ncbi:MAG TPA: hypothetical protein VFR47_24705 [Anaerolineales bacterium]|nr:hypothetical protein [Anaerolineales bacterium]
MNEKINQYLNGVFAPYEGVKSVAELKADLLSDLQERFRELKAEGKDDETALAMTIDSIGDIEQYGTGDCQPLPLAGAPGADKPHCDRSAGE